jgi:ribosomal protein S8
MEQSCKHILAQLKVAESRKKKKLIILTTNNGFTLLNFLWSEGFIYGYYRIGLQAIVFLKYYITGRGFFLTLHICDQRLVTTQRLKSLYFLNRNNFYIVLTVGGIFSLDFCIKKKLGGSVICQLLKGV